MFLKSIFLQLVLCVQLMGMSLCAMSSLVIPAQAGIQAIEEKTTQKPPQKITIGLEYFLNPHHTPLVIAIVKGFFKEEGLEVSLLNVGGCQQSCIQVAHGAVDFALSMEPQFYVQQHQGMTIRIIASLIAQPLEVFVSTRPLSELKGSIIGHASTGIGFSNAVIGEILKSQGLTHGDVELKLYKKNLTVSLLNQSVHSMVNVYKTYQLHDIREHIKQSVYAYSYQEFGVPDFHTLVLIGKENRHPAEAALRRALQKAITWLKAHPDEAWQAFCSFQPELKDATNARAFEELLDIFSRDLSLPTDTHREKIIDFLKKHQVI